MGMIQRITGAASKLRNFFFRVHLLQFICIAAAFLLFIDVAVYPLWAFTVFPIPRIALFLFLLGIFFSLFRKHYPTQLAKNPLILTVVLSAFAFYQFYASSTPLLTFGELISPTNLLNIIFVNSLLAWLIPSLSWSIASSDVVLGTLQKTQTPNEVRLQARKAPYYIPWLFISCLPIVFFYGFTLASPLPIRELAIYILLGLACFVWFIELPGYIAISRWKGILRDQLWTLESSFALLTEPSNIDDAWVAMMSTGFRIVPSILSPEVVMKSNQFNKDEFQKVVAAFKAKQLTPKKWLEILNLRIGTTWLEKQMRLVALATIEEIKQKEGYGEKLFPEFRTLLQGFSIEKWRSDFLLTVGRDLLYRARDLEIDDYWLWLHFGELQLPSIGDDDLLFIMALLTSLFAYIELQVRKTYPSFALEKEGKERRWFHILRGDPVDIISQWYTPVQVGEEHRDILMQFAKDWLGSALSQKLCKYYYYDYHQAKLPFGSTFSKSFQVSDYAFTIQLVGKERETILQQSSHPFPELAALASISGVGTLIALALRFVPALP